MAYDPSRLDDLADAVCTAERGRAQAASPKPPDSHHDDWPEPKPLPEGLAPVHPFDPDLLPASLRPWLMDIADLLQCAPEYPAVAAITALGSLIGRKVGLRPQAATDWVVTPNLWGLTIGRPGLLKSPAIEQGIAPLRALEANALKEFEAAATEQKVQAAAAKLRAEAGEKAARKRLAEDPEADIAGFLMATDGRAPPTPRRYVANDTSAAALGELHRQNPNGLLVHRDELVSLLKGLDREDNAEARGFYLTSWNGDSSYTIDRIGRGFHLHIPAVCLSLLGSTQPGRIAEYLRHAVRGGAGDDGLIQRFGLLVWPDQTGWREVDRWPNSDAKWEAYKVFCALAELDPIAVGARQDTGVEGDPEGIPYLRFDEGGLGIFREWRADLENKLRGGDLHPAMESHLAKYRKLVPGLALILHLANGGTGPVPEPQTLQALAWGEYLESHARRAYGSVAVPELNAANAIVQRLRRGDLSRTFRSWEVWRPGWAMLSDRDVVVDALRLLVDLDWLAVARHKTAGREATVYLVNPRGLKS